LHLHQSPIGAHVVTRHVVEAVAEAEIAAMDLDLTPTEHRQHRLRAVADRRLHDARPLDDFRHPPVDRCRRGVDVVDELTPRPVGAELDVAVAAFEALPVLRQARQHAKHRVGVAGDVGQHVPDRPAR
jgi:hypothetical protein